VGSICLAALFNLDVFSRVGAALIAEVVPVTFGPLFTCPDDATFSSESSDDTWLLFPLAASTLERLKSSEPGLEVAREIGSLTRTAPLVVGSAGVEILATGDEPIIWRVRGPRFELPRGEALGCPEDATTA